MSEKRIISLFALVVVVTSVLLTSCDPSKKYAREEQNKIQQYLSDNSTLAFEKKASGLYFLEVQAGTGNLAVQHDTAYVKYTGKFLDGTVFDKNVGTTDTLKFPVNEGYLINGFDEALLYMKKGSKALILVPSTLGYGPAGYYTIGGYTPLLFDIELVKLVHPASK